MAFNHLINPQVTHSFFYETMAGYIFNGYPDYLVGMRERKVADKLNPQRISWLMAR